MSRNNKHPILESGTKPVAGQKYVLVEEQDFEYTIIRDPFDVTERVNESTGETELVETRVEDGPMILAGKMQCAGRKNKNGRVYTVETWKGLLDAKSSLMERIAAGGCDGQIEHPENGVGSIRNASHRVTKLWAAPADKDGYVDIMGECELFDTQDGRHLRALARAKFPLGTSSRGAGCVDEDGTVSEYECDTWDMVRRPSTHGAILAPKKSVARGKSSVKESVTAPAIVPANNTLPPTGVSKMDVKKLLASVNSQLALFESATYTPESKQAALAGVSNLVDTLSDIAATDATQTWACNEASKRLDRLRARIEAPAVSDDASDDNDAVDEEIAEALRAAGETIDTLEAERDAANAALKEVTEKAAVTEKSLAEALASVKTLTESVAQLTAKAAGQSVAEAVEEAVKANPAVAGIRPLLEGCKTVEDVRKYAATVGPVAKKPDANEGELPAVGGNKASIVENEPNASTDDAKGGKDDLDENDAAALAGVGAFARINESRIAKSTPANKTAQPVNA